MLQHIRPLREKGYVSAFRVQQQQSTLLQAQTQLKTLARQRLDVAQQIGDTQQKLAQIPLTLSNQRSSTQRQLDDVEQQLAQNEAQRAVVLRAQRSGVVSSLLVKAGQSIRAQQPLMSVLPSGATLQAQLLVPSRAVGFIDPGSRVVLRYQAYPYQKFGQHYGKVSAISRSALGPTDVAVLIGQQVKQPLYRVTVDLDRQSILAYGKSQTLKPGMALNADILMDRRSLIEWAFEPLYGLGRRPVDRWRQGAWLTARRARPCMLRQQACRAAGLQFGWRRRLPMTLQTEAAECGLACLAMVASFYGHVIDLPSLRRRFSTSLKGANLARVIDMAGQLDFQTRPLRLELDEFNQLKTPCILHWDLNHFVVLKRVNARSVEIHDPAHGERKLSFKQVSEHFTGVALELHPKANFRPVKARQAISLRALTGKTRGLAGALTQILLLALALEVFTLVGPFYMQWVIDQALVSADHNLLTLLGIGFLLVAIFKVAITAARSWAVTCLGATLNVQWITNVFGHLLHLPLDWFEKRHIGDVVSRFNSMHTIQQTLTTQFIGSMLDGIMSLVTLIVLAFYSIPLMLLVTGLFLLYGLVRWAFFRPLRRAQEDQIITGARQQSDLLESIRGVMPIKLANQQSERQGRYANKVVDTVNRSVGIQRLNISFNTVSQLIFGIGHVAIIWWAAALTLNGEFTAGMLIAFVTYASQFFTRSAGLIDKLVDFGMLKLHAERVADIALTEPEVNPITTYDGPLPDASIEVRNLSFRYSDGEPWILKDCSFRIESGESVAITGPSGCGKTTLAKIILGLLEPEEGEILFGGTDIKKLGADYYRSMVASVMQDDQLFAGSIADNIAFFDPAARNDKIQAAAKLAAIHEEIAAMPMGYQTLVGDMGSSLSGGQKQRVILARALYRQPKLLVLDEATSHLDVERESRVNAAVKRLRLTRIVIAHRPETAASAQRALLVVDGAAQAISPLLPGAEVVE